MKNWLISAFVVLGLAGGMLAGIPLHAENSHMMKCCLAAKRGDNSAEAASARLCCAVNCSNSAPTSTSPALNFAPAIVPIDESIAKQIASLLARQKPAPAVITFLDREFPPPRYQPKYLQHQSFLI